VDPATGYVPFDLLPILGTALIAILVTWWAGQVDWSAWVGLCRAAFDQDRRTMALLEATIALLALQSIALWVVTRDVAGVSVATGWLLAAIVLALADTWYRD
jgi:hypothetical protein